MGRTINMSPCPTGFEDRSFQIQHVSVVRRLRLSDLHATTRRSSTPINSSFYQRHLSPSFIQAELMKDFQMAQPARAIAKRTIRRHELREIVPLADTTIYDMEQRGEFPQRFYLTSRCVVWDLGEVEAWLDDRRRASRAKAVKRAPVPDVQLRKTRPVRHQTRA